MDTQLIGAAMLVCCFSVIVNLGLVFIVVKLYTEWAKEKFKSGK